jgi:hypothetical protein
MIAIGVGAALLLAAAVALVILGWRSYQRRLLLRLVVRTEAVEAASAALIEAVSRLSATSDEEIEVFADEVDSVERRALAEVRSRASMIADEIDHLAVPKRLLPAAEAIADAAFVVSEQAGMVDDQLTGVASLEALAMIDLVKVRGYARKARMLVTGACEVCGLDETAVYGGGLYL